MACGNCPGEGFGMGAPGSEALQAVASPHPSAAPDAAWPPLAEVEGAGPDPFHFGPPWVPPWWFSRPIAGIERTQATQYFLFNGKGSGYAPQNTVPLVASRDLILRVYARSDSFMSWPHAPSSVTGRVSYPGRPDLSPINGPISALASSAIDRGNPNHTLNFRVPGAHCTGTVTFTVTVFDPAHPEDAGTPTVTTTLTLTFDSVPRVRIHGVLVHYTGRGMNIPAPTGVDLVNTLVWVGRTYPIPGFNYTACEVIEFNGDLTVGGGGGCGTGWNQLFNQIWSMRAASGTTDVFVGLLPPGVPTSGVIGCGGGGVAIAYKDGGTVLAQEIGHAFGRGHAPCGVAGDPSYPTYDAYPSGSIGEFGFDGAASQVSNPASTYDFMSYCGPVWTSPYTYIGLKNGITASPAAAHPERAGGREPEREYLYLRFRVDRTGKVELLPSFHLPGPGAGPELGPRTDVTCDLLGPKGELLDSHRCGLTNPHMDPDGPVIELHEVVAWSPEVRSIVFRRGDEVCHTLEVEEKAPEVTLKAPKITGNLARLEWSAKAAPRVKGTAPLTYVVRYSHDAGQTWRPLAADLTEPKLVVNLDLLPGGEECVFQVVASSGIRTALATTEPVAIPEKPCLAHIVSPEDGATFSQGDAVELLGGGFSPNFETTEYDDVSWTSSQDGRLGTGYQVVTNSLSPGRHRITLRVPDLMGGESIASRVITIR